MQPYKMQQKQEEQSNGHTSTDTQDKENYPLIDREKIANTPFWIVGNQELGYKLTWGKYTFMDEPAKTIDETYVWYQEHPWEITMHLIAIGLQIADDAKNKKEQ